MSYIVFEDYGTFYQNPEMVKKDIVMSAGSHILYDISDCEDVKIIKIADDSLFGVMWPNVSLYNNETEKVNIIRQAAVYREEGKSSKLIWED